MASASTAKSERKLAKYTAKRLAAARGEKVPLTVAGWVRFSLRAFGILLLLLVFVPLHYLYRIFAYGSPFPMLFLRFTAWIVGARVKIVGTPLRRDVFFISNHISWVDILSMAGASGTAFVAKQELSEVPVIGWLCGLNRTVFVKRENRMGVAEQINALREALQDNWSVTVFPEGTVTDGHSLLPFKSSMISVLEPPPAGVMVQPVVLDYGENAEDIAWIGEESGLHNAMRVMARKGSFRLSLHYLEPFSPVDYRGRKAVAAKAREEIERQLVANLGGPLRDFQHVVEAVRYRPKASTEISD
ncbi:lysophospholipid acyltransferase family protein [Qipengyuania pacifica]|jgi:1-acyl-sn-glycerol-3-phosphate acyltransferase|uniref:lysophospholipid acyltransferase family protein n=1 Tax=Qipengyuania pacifica TaxID=2860199 RepID=UPI001C9DC2B1|nr:lysophospholipid acyltransferase family protein [Qipengyuania pacifica]MBY8332712.1 1-acyl-sn-glycerol-3-phosphate acyltransferase [Qipengyuania pacifica]